MERSDVRELHCITPIRRSVARVDNGLIREVRRGRQLAARTGGTFADVRREYASQLAEIRGVLKDTVTRTGRVEAHDFARGTDGPDLPAKELICPDRSTATQRVLLARLGIADGFHSVRIATPT